jgi:hypothetical protein
MVPLNAQKKKKDLLKLQSPMDRFIFNFMIYVFFFLLAPGQLLIFFILEALEGWMLQHADDCKNPSFAETAYESSLSGLTPAPRGRPRYQVAHLLFRALFCNDGRPMAIGRDAAGSAVRAGGGCPRYS